MTVEETHPRLFVAVPAPEEAIAELTATRQRLEAAGAPRLRWVRPEGLHVTLTFLGETPPARVPAVQAAMAEAAIGTRRHCVALGALGLNSERRPRVLWVEMADGAEALARLAERLVRALVARGFEREGRTFRPHLTLGRVPDRLSARDRARLRRVVGEAAAPAAVPLQVTTLHLMRSRLTREGARYQRCFEVALAAAAVGRGDDGRSTITGARAGGSL